MLSVRRPIIQAAAAFYVALKETSINIQLIGLVVFLDNCRPRA